MFASGWMTAAANIDALKGAGETPALRTATGPAASATQPSDEDSWLHLGGHSMLCPYGEEGKSVSRWQGAGRNSLGGRGLKHWAGQQSR
jgi:hypothetical protein